MTNPSRLLLFPFTTTVVLFVLLAAPDVFVQAFSSRAVAPPSFGVGTRPRRTTIMVVAKAAAKDDASMSKEEKEEEKHAIAMEKATKSMTAFTNKYLKNTGTTLCSDKSIAAVVVKGLAEHKVSLGSPLCPCRFYEDKEAEAKDGYWNCPCVPMRERHECHCMLFLTEENDFAGTEQEITVEEVKDLSGGLSM